MLPPQLLLGVYCLLIGAASLGGGLLTDRMTLTHRAMQHLVSFVGGLMLSVALLHMIPHAAAVAPSLDVIAWWTLCGVVLMFFLLRAFHFHHYGPADAETFDEGAGAAHDDRESQVGHSHAACDHPDHAHGKPPESNLAWTGVFFGLSVHTLLDGAALAAAVQAESAHDPEAWLWGVGIFAAVLLHKPLDAVSITALMAAAGWPTAHRRIVNAAFALMAPLGALAFAFGVGAVEDPGPLVARMLAFSAGAFLCIALADLLPELELHSHDRLGLSSLLLAGVLAGWGIGLLEPEHVHAPGGGLHDGVSHGGAEGEHDHSAHP